MVSLFLKSYLHVPKDAGGKKHTLFSKVSSTNFALPPACLIVSLEVLLLPPYFDPQTRWPR